MTSTQKRLWYLLFTLMIIGLGLLSRKAFIPELIYPYLGDVLYTFMFYFIFAFLLPDERPLRLAGYSIALCFLIELSQLYQADWINNIRQTRLGGLILGFGFRWSDLFCYGLGGLMGAACDSWYRKKSTRTHTRPDT
ncbi:MAG: DUF2809 domain-containing protein [Bacteroidota bacterium]